MGPRTLLTQLRENTRNRWDFEENIDVETLIVIRSAFVEELAYDREAMPEA